ncbi:DUF2244 domain-containing protein [Altericroceibacterium endophyticum]|uniref:DUF2244 domain-containing protein n=1 Tax=Altericroceibacterium endophyticum TaxID=1808508 RepID=A0A6I4T768_9SPHN|nr:DUF2244 domain-containing protein [Altericroceibacterium endophyticum]MXO66062.1 DUF2244 domain-containing protein [Altericroceibacterium endophyticum]
MYSIHTRPSGRPVAEHDIAPFQSDGLLLRLQENRSSLSQEARVTFTVLIGLFMALTILPALKGQWLVPISTLTSMALLVGALEYHKRSQVTDEWLAIEANHILYRNAQKNTVRLPLATTFLVEEGTGSDRLRLFLKNQWHMVEIACCLGLEEKLSLASLISQHLKRETR